MEMDDQYALTTAEKVLSIHSNREGAITGIKPENCPLTKGTKARQWWMYGYNKVAPMPQLKLIPKLDFVNCRGE
jgi:hypothetical protein